MGHWKLIFLLGYGMIERELLFFFLACLIIESL